MMPSQKRTAKQRRLKPEIEEIAAFVQMDHWNISNYEEDGRTTYLEMMKFQLVRGRYRYKIHTGRHGKIRRRFPRCKTVLLATLGMGLKGSYRPLRAAPRFVRARQGKGATGKIFRSVWML
jgi:hypothetical protein